MSSCERVNRSVLDYPFTKDLVKALEVALIVVSEDGGDSQEEEQVTPSSSIAASATTASIKNDWILPIFDATTCKPQSVQAETKRLQVLNTFMILETEKEDAFDDITAEAVRVFDVPWALVSLVDLGRQWFKSVAETTSNEQQQQHAVLGCTETARRDAFCNYAIQSKDDIFIIPDATVDVRFCDNPNVTGGPKIRFYAGVPLEVPALAATDAADDEHQEEGVRLGTLCLADNKRHPNGLTATQQHELKQMAARVVQLLVDRRAKLQLEQTERKHERRVRQQASQQRRSMDEESSCSSSTSSSTSANGLDEVKKSRTGGSPKYTPRIVASPQRFTPDVTGDEPVSLEEQSWQQQQQQIQLLPLSMVAMNLPDHKTAGVDPDTYLAQLVQAMYGIKVQPKAALELQDFFPTITEEQMAAYSMQVVMATRQNELSLLREIVATQGPQAVNCFNRFGEGLLNLACRRGFKDIVAFFIHDVGLNVRTRDDGGRTPMHDACWNPEPLVDICTWLVEKDPSLLLIKDKRGYTAFQYARNTDWHVWRKFLFDNRHALGQGLARADIVKTFAATAAALPSQAPYQAIG
jgi:Ankyrin repeats (3 copies)/GAF domain